MRVLRVLLVGGFACATLLLVAPDAGAARAPKTTKACKSLTALQNDLNDVDPSDSEAFDAGAFEEIGDAFHAAAKKAPKQVKRALGTLGDFYEDLSNADSSVEALQEYGERGEAFSKAITKFSTFYAAACGATATTTGS